MRQKISALFGFHLSDEESLHSYMTRMDKIGQLDLFKIVKLILILAEEIEELKVKPKTIAK